MNENTRMIISLYDGIRTASEVASIVGLSARYVRKVALRHNLLRLGVGARAGKKNHQFVSGRRVDPDGYVLVTAPKNHPYARHRTNRNGKLIFEHRLVLEEKLHRYLLPTEVADHLDGLTLHNDPENLRVFDKNGDHLRATITGKPKHISASGRRNIKARFAPLRVFEPVDIYLLRRKRGDVRLRQILLAALLLGIDSPYLLGTSYWLTKAGIDASSRSKIELALDELNQRWGQDLSR